MLCSLKQARLTELLLLSGSNWCFTMHSLQFHPMLSEPRSTHGFLMYFGPFVLRCALHIVRRWMISPHCIFRSVSRFSKHCQIFTFFLKSLHSFRPQAMRCRVYLLWYVLLEALPLPLLSSTPTRLFSLLHTSSLPPAFPRLARLAASPLLVRSQGRKSAPTPLLRRAGHVGFMSLSPLAIPLIHSPSGCIPRTRCALCRSRSRPPDPSPSSSEKWSCAVLGTECREPLIDNKRWILPSFPFPLFLFGPRGKTNQESSRRLERGAVDCTAG